MLFFYYLFILCDGEMFFSVLCSLLSTLATLATLSTTLLLVLELGFIGFSLGVDLLLSSLLDFSHGLLLSGISDLIILISLSLDLLQRDTDNSLLDSDGSLLLLLGDLVSFDLLVESSPGGGPSDSLGLNLGKEELSGLLGKEEVGLAVLRDVSVTSAGVDLVLREHAGISSDDHFLWIISNAIKKFLFLCVCLCV